MNAKRVGKIGTAVAGLVLLVGCAAEQQQSDDELLAGTDYQGQQLSIAPSELCPGTVRQVPEGFVAVPDPSRRRLVFVPRVRALEVAKSKLRPAMYDDMEEVSDGYGSITCTCSSHGGGCYPFKYKDQAGCVMNGCTACSSN